MAGLAFREEPRDVIEDRSDGFSSPRPLQKANEQGRPPQPLIAKAWRGLGNGSQDPLSSFQGWQEFPQASLCVDPPGETSVHRPRAATPETIDEVRPWGYEGTG